MVKPPYIPDRGDIIWLDFNPAEGHEQKGRRPALVLSRKEYNKKTDLALVCPLTSKSKGYPFEVAVNEDGVLGVILADHVKNADWKARKAKLLARVGEGIMEEVVNKLKTLI